MFTCFINQLIVSAAAKYLVINPDIFHVLWDSISTRMSCLFHSFSMLRMILKVLGRTC